MGCDAASPIRTWAGAAWWALLRRAGPEGGPGSRKAAAFVVRGAGRRVAGELGPRGQVEKGGAY